MWSLKTIERVFAVLGALASLAGLYFMLSDRTGWSVPINIPPNIPTGLALIILGVVLFFFAGALVLAGRSWGIGQARSAELTAARQDLDEASLRIERLESENARLVETEQSEGQDFLHDLDTRIRGILKAGSLARNEIIKLLGLNPNIPVHSQAVAKSLGEMDDVKCDSLGRYHLNTIPF